MFQITNTYNSLVCQLFVGGFASSTFTCGLLPRSQALRVITKPYMTAPKEAPSPLSTVWCIVVVSTTETRSVLKVTGGVLKVLLENVVRDAVTYTKHSKAFTVMDFIWALRRQLSPYNFYT